MTKVQRSTLLAPKHYHWLRGIEDSMKIVEDRRRFLQSLGPAATPKPGVIEALDEILILLQAMRDRGSYRSSSQMMTVAKDDQ
jgi:hypothetical protein